MIPVAIIFDNFGPYHLARLQAAASVGDLLAIEVVSRSATYAWTNDPDAGKFRRVTLAGNEAGGASNAEIRRKLGRELTSLRPGVVVVPGWASAAAWVAMSWCLQNGVPMVCMSESTAWDEPRTGWKERIKRELVGTFSAALVGGAPHRDYLVALGLPESRIFFGYDAVDNGYFRESAKIARSSRVESRERRDLPHDYFLASARFVPKKNLPRLLEAYARYRSSSPTPWSLVLLGDGELRPELERQVDSLGLRGQVLMPGFMQYEELPFYYALAGVFIHPSTIEPWGLVVNEAMASGLPVLVSHRCGCAPELVREGTNGFTFDPLDVDGMARKMAQIAAPDFPRAAFGAKSREIVAKWGVERFAQGLSESIEAALANRPERAGVAARVLLWLLNRK